MPNVITLTGPSGAGKSTIIKYFLELKNKDFNPVVIPKYTTREARKGELTRRSPTSLRQETICVKKLPKKCDLVYEQYGSRYGIQLKVLYDKLAQKKSPIVILNDVRAVEDIRTSMGGLVRSIFLFREVPSLENHMKLAKERGLKDEKIALTRYQKANSIYRIYIENIQLFDHVILNLDKLEVIKKQAALVIKGMAEDARWPLKHLEKNK